MNLLSINFPSWLKPEIIPGLPVRWYGLMYIVAFAVAFWAYRRQVRERRFPMSEDELTGLFFWGILCLVAGARVFYALFYETSGYYRRQPWLIFWPFRDGSFTGFSGMSYHGGVIGGIFAIIIYSKKHGFDMRETGDMFAASIPLGFTFGRLGNFINGELFGRITDVPWGMVFPHGGIYPSDKNFALIREGAEALGIAPIPGANGMLNFPRHPSQLYEMFFEGVFLWAIIWLFRNRKPFKGFLITLYLSGYGLVRFFIEYFREPDAELGYRIQFVTPDLPPALSHPLLCFSQGQILCFAMIVAGLLWMCAAMRMPDRTPERIYAEDAAQAAQKTPPGAERSERNRRRNQRHKLTRK
jgi:phosphatidylglycerol:prolipoprotein diacylglycerol transferase